MEMTFPELLKEVDIYAVSDCRQKFKWRTGEAEQEEEEEEEERQGQSEEERNGWMDGHVQAGKFVCEKCTTYSRRSLKKNLPKLSKQ